MKIFFSAEGDYQYQLYLRSKDRPANRRIWYTVSLYSFGILLVALYSYHTTRNDQQLLLFLIIIAFYIITSIASKKFFYKRNLRKYLKKTYQQLDNKSYDLSVVDEHVYVRDEGKETKLSPTLFKELIDVDDYYFLRLKSEGVYIISKSFTPGIDEFVDAIKALHIPIIVDKWASAK